MREKMHIAVLTLGVCTLIGLTFAISTKDYKEKDPQLNSASTPTTKFVCNTKTISESSQETNEYYLNLVKLGDLLSKIDALGGDTITYHDPCEGLKGKDKSQCIKKNVQLRATLQQIKKLEKKLIPYEDCQVSLGVTKKPEKTTQTNGEIIDCGLVDDIGELELSEKKILSCISDAAIICTPASIDFLDSDTNMIITYTIRKKSNNNCNIGVWDSGKDLSCDIPIRVIKELEKYSQKNNIDSNLLIFPIAELIAYEGGTITETGEEIKLSCQDYKIDTTWFKGEWSTCSNSKQKRTVECQSDGKKVADKKCEGKKPSTTKVCKNIDFSTTNTKDSSITQKGITQLQGKYTALEAVNILEKAELISPNSIDRIDDTILFQDHLDLILRVMNLVPNNRISDYKCKHIFTDISEPRICRIAEIALENGIIKKQGNESGDILFRGTVHQSLYQVLHYNMLSQCMKVNTFAYSYSSMLEMAKNLGITNTSDLNLGSAATKGDVYIALATFIDSANLNTNDKLSSGYFDTSIAGCTDKISGI